MGTLNKYRRREKTTVTAVRVALEFEGFTYEKWGGTQRCEPGDWLVNNAGDTYTIDADTFAGTYREFSPGVYAKDAPIWAERAEASGVIPTEEGSTKYVAGDVLVYNGADRVDGYAMSQETFERLYELAE